jgi:hypothetical protein
MRPYDAVTNPSGGNFYSNTVHPINPDSVPVPMPMMSEKTKSFFNDKAGFPYMTMMNVYDSTNPGFLIPPTNVQGIKGFLVRKWTDNSDTTWAFDPNSDINQIWPMNEQLRYSNTTLRTAAMGGYPLGDLYRWWSNIPTHYSGWSAQKNAEYAQIEQILANGVTSVPDQPMAVPTEHELDQNYPNPFNPSTQIEYTIRERGHVSLKVFNIAGQEVATIFSGVLEPGDYSTPFDASTLTSGIYLYRLTVGGVSTTKRMVLVK